MTDIDKPLEDGFELEGVFYRWQATDTGKDLMLIDRFTGLPVHEFFAIIEDNFDRGRAPILLALMATSIRAKFPDRSVERIVRQVQDLSLGEVAFIDGEEPEGVTPQVAAVDEKGIPVPPAMGGEAMTEPPTRSSSVSLVREPESPMSERSSEIPA